MFTAVDLVIGFLIALVTTLVVTFPVKKLAVKWGVLDYPEQRKIHTDVTPRLGGLAIFIGAVAGGLYLMPRHDHLPGIFFGALVIIITGSLDDRYSLRPLVKLSGQLIATTFVISSGLIIEQVTLPIVGTVSLGFFSVLLTVFWVIGITNAINLIDGLDGLATGVSGIALTSIFVIALLEGQPVAAALCIILIGANAGFLYHNFYPAKIYMGDTGSNFLGFMIASISMLGLFKSATFFSFILPIIVLAIPIFDTLLSIVRRAYNKEGIMQADNKHLHYQLLKNGYGHRQTVLIIYGFSALFGFLAILYSRAGVGISLLILLVILVLLHIFLEIAGLIMGGKRPVLDLLVKPFKKKPGSR